MKALGMVSLLKIKVKAYNMGILYLNLCAGWCFVSNSTHHKGGRIIVAWNPRSFHVDILVVSSQLIHRRVKHVTGNGFFYIFLFCMPWMIHRVENLFGKNWRIMLVVILNLGCLLVTSIVLCLAMKVLVPLLDHRKHKIFVSVWWTMAYKNFLALAAFLHGIISKLKIEELFANSTRLWWMSNAWLTILQLLWTSCLRALLITRQGWWVFTIRWSLGRGLLNTSKHGALLQILIVLSLSAGVKLSKVQKCFKLLRIWISRNLKWRRLI